VHKDETTGKFIKRPLTIHGFNNAELEDFKIIPMFEDPPLRMRADEDMVVCGVVGPAGIVIIDLDHKPGGLDGVTYGLEKLALPRNTYTVDSISKKGMHLWYSKSDPYQKVGNSGGWPGIDVRGDAGYVVLPGSTTRWGSWDADPSYPWPASGVLPELPEKVWETLVARGWKGVKSTAGPIGDVRTMTAFDLTEYLPFMDSEIPALLEHLSKEGSGSRVLRVHQDDEKTWLDLTCDGVSVSATLGFISPTGLNVFAAGWPGRPIGGQDVLPPPPWLSETVANWVENLLVASDPEDAEEPTEHSEGAPAADAATDGAAVKGERPGERDRDVPIARKACADLKLHHRFKWANGLGLMMWDDHVWKPQKTDSLLLQTLTVWVEWRLSFVKPLREKDGSIKLDETGKPRMPRSPLERYRDINGLNALVKACRVIDGMEVDACEMDAKEWLITTPSGTVDTRTGELRPSDPADNLTRMTAVPYEKGATHPDWDKALEALPDVETMRWLQKAVGACLTGRADRDDPVIFHYGDGRNGKSTVLEGIMETLGLEQLAALVPDSLVTAGQGDAHAGMSLRNIRFACKEELAEGHVIPIPKIKAFNNTPVITSRALYQMPITFVARHTLHISTNYIPFVAETDDGTWRRMVMIKYDKKFVGEDKDGDLRYRCRTDVEVRKAILAWAVEGALLWQAGGMTLDDETWTDSMNEATRAWRMETDQVTQFLDEMVEPTGSDEDVISTEDLWLQFDFWNSGSGVSWTQRTFKMRLKSHTWMRTHYRGVRRYKGTGATSLHGARLMASTVHTPRSTSSRDWMSGR
jgi:P4 family phage/plasmid primase-like protien